MGQETMVNLNGVCLCWSYMYSVSAICMCHSTKNTTESTVRLHKVQFSVSVKDVPIIVLAKDEKLLVECFCTLSFANEEERKHIHY